MPHPVAIEPNVLADPSSRSNLAHAKQLMCSIYVIFRRIQVQNRQIVVRTGHK